MAHPFRFAVGPSGLSGDRRPGASRDAWTGFARHVESLGYSALHVGDHPHDRFGRPFGPLLALMAAADATTSLRLGAITLNNELRPLVPVAHDASTLDVLSGGRLELGLGAGWVADDFGRVGVPMESAGSRIERLEEAVAL